VGAAAARPAGGVEGLLVKVEQDENTPPMVMVSDGRRKAALIPPDKALGGLQRSHQSAFTWKESNGVSVTGGLVLPLRPAKGGHIPLVIQSYYYFQNVFLPDGISSGAYAAQALAAKGMAVLQMDMLTNSSGAGGANGNEGPEFVDRVDAAVEALAREKGIDPARVALIGFSRAGYRVYYTITHPGKTRLAAVVCDDNFLGSYATYLEQGATDLRRAAVVYDKGPGGSFWQKKAAWLDYETSFNVDRVMTPALFALHGGSGPGSGPYSYTAMQVLGPFLMNRKPLEYLFFPTASHSLLRPQERLAMMSTVVDWMAFWLQDYEDPSPEKAQEYSRWRPMRAMLAAPKTTQSSRQ